jgi:hypothetical protein
MSVFATRHLTFFNFVGKALKVEEAPHLFEKEKKQIERGMERGEKEKEAVKSK